MWFYHYCVLDQRCIYWTFGNKRKQLLLEFDSRLTNQHASSVSSEAFKNACLSLYLLIVPERCGLSRSGLLSNDARHTSTFKLRSCEHWPVAVRLDPVVRRHIWFKNKLIDFSLLSLTDFLILTKMALYYCNVKMYLTSKTWRNRETGSDWC